MGDDANQGQLSAELERLRREVSALELANRELQAEIDVLRASPTAPALRDSQQGARFDPMSSPAHSPQPPLVHGITHAVDAAPDSRAPSAGHAALQDVGQQWRSLVEQSIFSVVTIACDGTVLLTSESAATEAPYGKPITETCICDHLGFSAQERERFRAQIAAVFDSGRTVFFESVGVGADGTTAYYQSRLVPLLSASGITAAAYFYIDVTEMRRALVSLAISEETFRRIFEALPHPAILWEAHPDGHITFNAYTPAAYDWSKGHIDTYVGMEVEDFFVDTPERAALLRRAHETGETQRLERKLQRLGATGEQRWLRTTYARVNERFVLNFIEDTTEQVLSEQALKDSEDKFRQVIAQSIDGILLADESGTVIEWTPALERLTGVAREQAIRRPVWDVYSLLSPEADRIWKERAAFDAEMRHVRETPPHENPDPDAEQLIHLSDGTQRVIQIRAFPVETSSGSLVALAIRDSTDAKRAERELRESESLLKQAQRIAQAGSWQLDPQTGETVWSEGVFHVYGVDPADRPLPYTEHYKYYHPDDWPAIKDAIERAVSEGVGYNLEVRVVRPDGSIRYVQTMCEPTLDASGKVTNVVGAIQDVTDRLRVERELRESENLLKQAQRIAHTGSWRQDSTSGETVWSEGVFQVYGVDPADGPPPYADHYKYYHPDDWPAVKEAVERAVNEGIGYNLEVRVVRPDGSIRYVQTICEPTKDASGKITALAGAIQDVTDRLRVERELRESENLLKQAQRIAHTGSWQQDPVTGATVWSEGIFAIFGIDPAAGPPPYAEHHRLFHSDDWPTLAEAVRLAVTAGQRYSLEVRAIRADGEVRDVITMCEPEVDRDGKVTNLLGAIQDITERKRTERAMQDRQAELDEVIRSLPDALIYTDTDRHILRVNPAFTRIFGYEPEDVIGESTGVFYSTPESFAEQGRIRFNVSAPDVYEPYQIAYRRKSGEVFRAESIGARVRNANGELLGFLNVARDISDRIRLEEQLQHAQKMEAVGQLAGGVAHDFNNILTAIQGYTGFLMADVPSTHPSYGDLEGIRQASERATALTRQLLAFSRRQVLAPRLIDLNETTASMSKMLHRLIGEDIELITRAQPDLSLVKVDPGQIEQVILNLAVNARDAMPAGGTLTIETGETEIDETLACPCGTKHTGRCAVLTISDTGQGIPLENRPHIFEPFFTTKKTGTGLGLATVYGIVVQSGGHITLHSVPGAGTTFRVYLPIAKTEERGTPVGADQAKTAPGGTETLLLVEDAEAVRRLTERILRKAGYAVLTASNGEEALRRYSDYADPIHLLVSDIVMPGGMSGRELADRLHALRPAMRILFMSGYTDDAMVRHGVFAGRTPFLEKPFDSIALLNKVRETLDAQ